MRNEWCIVAALGAGLLGVEAPGQAPTQDSYPPLKWTARERFPGQTGSSANDEGKDIAHWKEVVPGQADKHWVFATGWVTQLNANGTVRGTRFATYKYDAADNGTNGVPVTQASAFFPPIGPNNSGISQGDTYKAYAMAVDPINGDIYVVGEGPHTAGVANNQDYWVVRYDKDLNPGWSGTGRNLGRNYEGPAAGNDIPADITLSESGAEVVVVTGTSPGTNTGKDIATVAWFTRDEGGHTGGTRAASGVNYWPSINGWGAGVRRYDYGIGGDDRGVELGPVTVASLFNQPPASPDRILSAVVLGTSYGGATLDDFTTHQWYTGSTGGTSSTRWDKRFDLGYNDTATGLRCEGTFLFCAGYSEVVPADNLGGGDEMDGPGAPALDEDYSIVSYNMGSNPPSQRWSDTWNYASAPDHCFDVATRRVGDDIHVWLTGEAKTGSRWDVGTVHYLDAVGGSVSRDYTTGFNAGGSTSYNYGLAVALQPSSTPLAYITGAVGYTSNDWLLTLKYTTGSPYTRHWTKLYSIDAFDEGRGIVVQQVDGTSGNWSTYVVGTSSASGNGRDFVVQRYRE